MPYEYAPKDYDNSPPDLNEVLARLADAVYEITRAASLETARQMGAEAYRAASVYLNNAPSEPTVVSEGEK